MHLPTWAHTRGKCSTHGSLGSEHLSCGADYSSEGGCSMHSTRLPPRVTRTFYAQRLRVSGRALPDDPDRYSQTTDFQQSRPICPEGCSGPSDRSAKKSDRFEMGIG